MGSIIPDIPSPADVSAAIAELGQDGLVFPLATLMASPDPRVRTATADAMARARVAHPDGGSW